MVATRLRNITDYAQANQLAEMRALDEQLRKDADLLFCRGTYLNNDYFG